MDGWSLLQTARDQDPGSPNGPVGTAHQQQQSANRNVRLFASIMNYIDPKSALYQYSSANFANDGRGLFNYLYVFGHLPYTGEELQILMQTWSDATMAKVQIKFDADAVFKWKEWVLIEGDKLGKTFLQVRTKFLEGFPEAYDVITAPERLSAANGGNGNYVFPAVYPAHFPAALAGNPHPNAGEPDIEAMANAFYIPWFDMINKGKIKAPPNGLVYISRTDHDDDSDEDDSVARRLTKSDVTKKSVCTACGGRGHFAQVDGIVCATKQLGIKIPPEELSQTQYPNGIKFPGGAYVKPKDPVFPRDKATKTKIKKFRREQDADDDANGRRRGHL